MIRGNGLEEAEQQLFRAGAKDPRPTDLQVEYVTASRQEETLRQKEQLKLDQKSRQRQRLVLWAVGVGLTVAVVLGIIAWGQRNQYLAETHVRATAQANAISEANARGTAQAEAISEANARATQESIAIAQKNEAVQQAKIAIAGALDTNSTVLLAKQIDLALLLSLEGYRFSPGPKTSGAMLNALLASSRLIRELHGTQSTVGSIAYSPDGKLLATDGCGLQNADFTCAYSETDLWNAQTGELVGKLTGVPQSAAAIGITFSPDSQQLLTFNRQGNVVIWDLETWQPVDKIKWHDRYVTAIAVQPGGRLVALGECTLSVQGVEAQFGCEPGLIELWDTTTHQPLNQTLTGNPGTISSLAFSPDGKYLAAGDYKGQLVLWNLQTGASQTIGDLGNVNFVNALAFSPDSGTLLAVDTTDKISFIDVVTGKSLKRSIQLPGSFASMAISPDGKILVTASCSNGTGIKCSTEVTFWDALTGIQIGQPLKGYSDYIPNLAFSPDGSTLALETIGEIQLYDLTSGQVIGPAITGMEVNGAIQFSPDGKTLASGRPVTLWAIDPAAWIAQACQIANRNLTQDEWQTYLGDQPYHQTCVNIP